MEVSRCQIGENLWNYIDKKEMGFFRLYREKKTGSWTLYKRIAVSDHGI